jgi:parallel beta-helix repeat protein
VGSSSDIMLDHNNCSVEEGIIISSSNRITFINHNLSGKKYGIRLSNTINSLIINNLITSNNYCGLYIDRASKKNRVENNIIAENGENGIECWGINNIFTRNHIEKNNNTGINFPYTSMFNKIYNNNFIDNIQNAYTVFNFFWDNTGRGNFWSDYTGIDSNSDGIGDTPHQIPRGYFHFDRYPLIQPVKITH